MLMGREGLALAGAIGREESGSGLLHDRVNDVRGVVAGLDRDFQGGAGAIGRADEVHLGIGGPDHSRVASVDPYPKRRVCGESSNEGSTRAWSAGGQGIGPRRI